MSSDLDSQLCQWYGQFGSDHQRLRDDLLASLPARSALDHVPVGKWRSSAPALRWALAAAAALLLLLGASLLIDNTAEVLNPPAAWAAAIENTGRLQSVHFKLTTFLARRPSSVEMWWRRPHDFRMAFDDGLIVTGDQSGRYRVDPAAKNVTVYDAGGLGLEMAPLGELGQLFTSKISFSQNWIAQSKVVGSAEVEYKNENCRVVTAEKDGRYYQYIINDKAPAGQAGPLLYDVKRFAGPEMTRLLSHVEVFEIDRPLPDSLFAITPAPGQKVNDRRSTDRTPEIQIPR